MTAGVASSFFEPLEPRVLLTTVWPIGEAAGQPPIRQVGLTDPDGTVIVVTVRGPGGGEVSLDDAGGLKVQLTGTNASTALTLKGRKGDGRIRLVEVTVDGALGSLIAPTADLRGSASINQGCTRLELGDASDGASLSLGASSLAAQVRLAKVRDFSLTSAQPLAEVAVLQWLDTDATVDSLTAPWLRKLTVTGGDKSVPGDFAAALQLSDAGAVNLQSARVTGSWLAAATLPGDVGSVTIGRLRAPFHVMGSAKSISVGDSLALAPSPSATGGILQIEGTARVRGDGENLTVTGARFYAGGRELYSLVELLRYGAAGEIHQYRQRVTDAGGLTAESLLRVETAAVPDPIQGHSATTVSEESRTTLGAFEWASDATAVLLGRSIEEKEGVTQYRFADLIAAPERLALATTFTDTSPVTVTLEGGRGVSLAGTLQGTAAIKSLLAGHESVTTEAGQFLAAKLVLNVTVSASGPLTVSGESRQTRLQSSMRMTLWCVPGQGMVKALIVDSTALSIRGLGSVRGSQTEQRLLTLPTAKDRYTFESLVAAGESGITLFGNVSISGSDTVAFDAWMDIGRGVFVRTPQGLQLVAEAPFTSVPGFGPLAIIGSPRLGGDRSLWFYGAASGRDGVFRYSDGQLRLMADTTGEYSSLGPQIGVSNAGRAVFQGFDQAGRTSLLAVDDGGLSVLYGPSAAIQSIDLPELNSSDRYAFHGIVDHVEGIYVGQSGLATTIARAGKGFKSFGAHTPISDAGVVAFVGRAGLNRETLLTADALGIHPKAGADAYRSFITVAINNSGQIAFQAIRRDEVAGIFVGAAPGTDTVIAEGDRLLGSWVTNLGLAAGGLGPTGQLAFTYQLADGRTGVVLAVPTT